MPLTNEQLQADVAYLARRANGADYGASVNRLVALAYGLESDDPEAVPHDADDLARCEGTFAALPEHRKTAEAEALLSSWVAGIDAGAAYLWRARDEDGGSVSGERFDELVVGKWLHVEHMSRLTWWIRVGAHVLWVTADKGGGAARVTVYPPGEYRDAGGFAQDPDNDRSWVRKP